ncbi:hypothetical protein CCR75_009022 [Bremia lactucae]|uniref:Uncharacterized protein n=1 Tax=Bremia lactucae TaxID=4779 RepID=A0A976FFH8_BRELC|nr:hypothetical protein CCR75_009022 [Bremia lactucae]
MSNNLADGATPRDKRLKLLREAKAQKLRDEKIEKADLLVAATLQPAEVDEGTQQTKLATYPRNESGGLDEKLAQKHQGDAKFGNESDDDHLELATQRANCDLERDIAPMLRKLERRTQHAIVEVLRENLAAEQEN